MRTKALFTVLSEKLRDGEVIFVDNIKVDEIKTKKVKEILSSLSSVAGFEGLATKKNNAAYITLMGKDENIEKSFRNFGNVVLNTIENINLLDVLNHKYLVITDPEKSIEVIGRKFAKTA
jgi:large subunit ribosomal protein L4